MILYSSGDLKSNMRTVLQRNHRPQMIQLIGRQHNTREIAQMLFIAEKKVENHRANIMKKLALQA